MKRTLLAAAVGLSFIGAATAHAEGIVRMGDAKSPIATSVAVPAPADMVYVSGLTPAVVDATATTTAKFGGDTKVQATSVFNKLSDALKAQGFSLGDVVMMRVLLVGDPAMGGKMDFGGMMAAYVQFFGTADQPNKPARITSQVVSLVDPAMLVEIEVQAAKKPAMPAMAPMKKKK
jgi:enamine deaminase RidA (YjgF/YER057c/UK114 family)